MHDVQVKTARGLARGLFLRGGHPRPSNAHRQVDYPAYSIVILPTTLCTICSYLLHQKYPCVMLFWGESTFSPELSSMALRRCVELGWWLNSGCGRSRSRSASMLPLTQYVNSARMSVSQAFTIITCVLRFYAEINGNVGYATLSYIENSLMLSVVSKADGS